MAQKSKPNKKRKNKRSPKKLNGASAKVSADNKVVEPVKSVQMETAVEDAAPEDLSNSQNLTDSNKAALSFLEESVLPNARRSASFMGMLRVKTNGGNFQNTLINSVDQIEKIIKGIKDGTTELDLSFVPSKEALGSMSRNERPSEVQAAAEEPKRGLLHKLKHAAKKLVGK